MRRHIFNASPNPTLGVEIELALVDADTMALTNANQKLLDAVGDKFATSIKPELMQCYIEMNTDVCDTVAQAEADLTKKYKALQSVADANNVNLLWSATHPFSSWQTQTVTPDDRYHGLVNLLQDTARQLITFGLHVHVGVDAGEKAVMICDRILRHLPVLLAATCNSPFWEGRNTGLDSWRSKVMDGLPTAGLPPLMRNWSEYVWLVNHLIETGFIETIREIWWDVRPHHNFGTVEVRICDVPGNLTDSLRIAALIQCLVTALSDQIDHGTYQHDCHPMMVRQNKWRAARYGLDAQLVDSDTYELKPARRVVCDFVEYLMPIAHRLDCADYLAGLAESVEGPTWAQRQLEMLSKTNDPVQIVRTMTAASRI